MMGVAREEDSQPQIFAGSRNSLSRPTPASSLAFASRSRAYFLAARFWLIPFPIWLAAALVWR
jgi:hypothetical protein